MPVRAVKAAPAMEKLDPDLQRLPDQGELVEVLVDLATQVELAKLAEIVAQRDLSRGERRRLTVAALEAVAAAGRRSLDPLLSELERRGSVSVTRGYAVVNRLRLSASPAALRQLAQQPQVDHIVARTSASGAVGRPRAVAGLVTLGAPTAEPRRRSWVLDAVGAERAWAAGLSGRGVVVGLLDSGASAVHEQLRGGFRGGERSWYDPGGGKQLPVDTAYGHGSGVLSVAVGRNRGGVTLGLAPGAQWIACAGLPDGHYDNVLVTECADWMLRVGRPDVLINAWLLPTDGCDREFAPILEAWRVAEILPIFAAGNHGPGLGTDHSPANYGSLVPGGGRTLAVGGLTRTGELFSRSAQGPSSCDGGIFPILTAPAVDVVTALPLATSSYLQAEGTSYAAGLVAGGAALLLERFPEASVAELEEALVESAVDLGPPGPDPSFGYGRLDIPAALDRLEGLLTGGEG